MKKFVTSLCCCVVFLQAQAQITFSFADLPTAGALWAGFEDNRTGIHSVGSAGANQVWNYTSTVVVDDTSALYFQAASAAPAPVQAAFPGSNLTIIDNVDTAYTMLSVLTSGLYIDGLYDGTVGASPAAINYDPSQLVAPTPFTMGSTRNDISKWSLLTNISGTNYKFELTTISDFTGDAWGALTTPAGNFPNTLRIKNVNHSVDSVFMEVGASWVFISSNGPSDTATSYQWFRNGAGSLVFEAQEDNSNPGMTQRISYFNHTQTGISESLAVVNDRMVVYPNPTPGIISVRFANRFGALLQITDINGKVLRSDNIMGLDRITIHMPGMARGTYLLRIIDGSGNQVESNRIFVTGE